jgi:hypothetical protein
MKTIFRFTLLVLFAALFAFLGASYENHASLRRSNLHAGDTLAIIGIATCKNFIGVMVVTKDGTVATFPGVTQEQAITVAKTVPDASTGLITIPCGAGDLTT